MSESKNNSKIEPIFISDEMLEEDNFDSKLRDRLIEDADELERALEADSKLDGIEAPAGMLDSITASLKDQGIWEDENASDASVGQKEELPGMDVAEAAEDVDNAEDAVIMEKPEIMKKAVGAEGLSDDDIYQLLSAEDRAALNLGRRLKKRKRWQKPLIKVICGIVVLGSVFGASIIGEANRNYIIGLWNSVVGDELSIDISYLDSSKLETSSESEAWELIHHNLGIEALRFGYYPQGFKYKDFEVSQDGGWANIFYEYKDCVFTIHVYKDYLEGKRNQKFDGKVLDILNITSSNNSVTITEIQNALDEKAYIADFEKDNVYYSMWGIMERNEFEKLVKSII